MACLPISLSLLLFPSLHPYHIRRIRRFDARIYPPSVPVCIYIYILHRLGGDSYRSLWGLVSCSIPNSTGKHCLYGRAIEYNRCSLAPGAVPGNTTTLPSQIVSSDIEEEGIKHNFTGCMIASHVSFTVTLMINCKLTFTIACDMQICRSHSCDAFPVYVTDW